MRESSRAKGYANPCTRKFQFLLKQDNLGISSRTLRLAAETGEIPGRHPLADGPWVFSESELETDAAQAVQQRVKKRKRAAVPNANQQNLNFSGT